MVKVLGEIENATFVEKDNPTGDSKTVIRLYTEGGVVREVALTPKTVEVIGWINDRAREHLDG